MASVWLKRIRYIPFAKSNQIIFHVLLNIIKPYLLNVLNQIRWFAKYFCEQRSKQNFHIWKNQIWWIAKYFLVAFLARGKTIFAQRPLPTFSFVWLSEKWNRGKRVSEAKLKCGIWEEYFPWVHLRVNSWKEYWKS